MTRSLDLESMRRRSHSPSTPLPHSRSYATAITALQKAVEAQQEVIAALQHQSQSVDERPLVITPSGPSKLGQDRPGTVQAIIWRITNFFFLGFAGKFLYRLDVYALADNQDEIDAWRSAQQDEWGRLGTTTSLMATISAASLAFSGIDQSWWLARAAFAGALGTSLCGFFVVHHLSVLAEGMRNQDMSMAIKGELLDGSKKSVACVLAVPVVISAYSTLLILFGHITFITTLAHNQPRFSGNIPDPGFLIVAGIPIVFSIVLMVGAVVAAEIMYRGVTAPKVTASTKDQGRTQSKG